MCTSARTCWRRAECHQGTIRRLDPADEAVEVGVRAQLEKARAATSRRDPVPGRLSNWWRGTLIEAAYHHLHAAESLIVELYSPEQVEADAPEAVARIDAGLPADDPRRSAAHELLQPDSASRLAANGSPRRSRSGWRRRRRARAASTSATRS